jgi:hypothetical protein
MIHIFIYLVVKVFRIILQKPPAAYSIFKDPLSNGHSLVIQLMQPFKMYEFIPFGEIIPNPRVNGRLYIRHESPQPIEDVLD